MSHKATTWAWSQKTISYMAKLVLLALADRHNADSGDCFPSISKLEADCCMSRSSIIRSVNELEQAGLITAIERRDKLGRNKSNQYKLHLDNDSPVLKQGELDGIKLMPPECPIDTREGVKQTPKPVIKNHTLTSLTEKEADSEVLVYNMSDFWNDAVGMLLAMGIAESTARQFTGRCLKLAKGDHVKVRDAYSAALNAEPRDPIPYITKVLTKPQSALEQKRSEYNAVVAELMSRPTPDGAWNNYGKPQQDDHPDGTREQDSECVYVDPFAEPDSVHEAGGGSTDHVRPEGDPKTGGPKGGYLGKMQIPSLDF
jgi:hypothetical protein